MGRLAVAKYFIDEKELDIIQKNDDDNNTPLQIAAEDGYLEVVQFLLEKDASVEELVNGSCTVLYYAARGDHLEVAQALLDNDTDIGAQKNNGDTALYLFAKESGCFAVST